MEKLWVRKPFPNTNLLHLTTASENWWPSQSSRLPLNTLLILNLFFEGIVVSFWNTIPLHSISVLQGQKYRTRCSLLERSHMGNALWTSTSKCIPSEQWHWYENTALRRNFNKKSKKDLLLKRSIILCDLKESCYINLLNISWLVFGKFLGSPHQG